MDYHQAFSGHSCCKFIVVVAVPGDAVRLRPAGCDRTFFRLIGGKPCAVDLLRGISVFIGSAFRPENVEVALGILNCPEVGRLERLSAVICVVVHNAWVGKAVAHLSVTVGLCIAVAVLINAGL